MKEKTIKPAKAKKPKKIIIREFVSVKHDYTQDERNECTNKMVSAIQHSNEQTEQLKAVSADFKARIKTADSVKNECTNQLANGYEMRNVEAEIHLDRKRGVKMLHFHAPGKPEHGKKIREEKMTQADYQRLPLDLPPENPKDEKKLSKKEQAAAAKEAATGAPVAEAEDGEQKLAV